MKSAKLADMTKGWIVGDFTPTCLNDKNMEVGIKFYKAGESEPLHHHKIAVELTTIVSGRVRMCNREWGAGDIIIIEPGEATAFEVLEDTVTIVVKRPSIASDKYLGAA